MWSATNHFICRRAARPERRSKAAFTVIELMLSVAILGVIVFALYSVFNQTQRALRSTNTQGDIAEKARAIADIISRELQQAKPTFSARRIGTNLYSEINLLGGFDYDPTVSKAYQPSVQKGDRADVQARTNFLQNLFFYTNHTNAWQGIGYRVIYVTNGVGALERYETNQFGFRPIDNQLSGSFFTEPLTNGNYHHIADGVIHLAFIPYDAQGYRLGFDTTNRSLGEYRIFRATADGSVVAAHSDVVQTNLATVILTEAYPNARAETLPYATSFAFKSNALPAYIDMELGILEPETLSQYYTMLQDENPNAASFLARQVSKVHLFRQRIPLRTAAQ